MSFLLSILFLKSAQRLGFNFELVNSLLCLCSCYGHGLAW